MNKNQHNIRTQALNPGISQSEVERKWRRYQEELEMLEMLESAKAFQAVVAVSSSGGGGGQSVAIEPDIVALTTQIDGDFNISVTANTGYVGVIWWDSATPVIFGDGDPLSTIAISKNNDGGASREVTFYSCSSDGIRTGTISYIYADSMDIDSLDLTKCLGLTTLLCGGNLLISLNVSGLSSLDLLDCSTNSLTSLGTLPSSLTNLNCNYNSLTTLGTLPANLTDLACAGNSLTTLDVSILSSLINLECSQNLLTSIGTLPITLTSLACGSNNLSTLDVSYLVNLTSLTCEICNLSSLDVSSLTLLTALVCSGNPITSLDTSNCPSLEYLGALSCQLTSVTTAAITAGDISFYTNQLSASAINSFFSGLGVWRGSGARDLYVVDNPGAATCTPLIATSKGWRVNR